MSGRTLGRLYTEESLPNLTRTGVELPLQLVEDLFLIWGRTVHATRTPREQLWHGTDGAVSTVEYSARPYLSDEGGV